MDKDSLRSPAPCLHLPLWPGRKQAVRRLDSLACRKCLNVTYVSQRQGQRGRKHLQACKLRAQLGGMPEIGFKLPKKPKWRHRWTYTKLLGKARGLEHTLTSLHWRRKQPDCHILAYHVQR